MKDFSNEKDNERKYLRNTTIKVIMKRFSFIVWVPVLIFVFHCIGRIYNNFDPIKIRTFNINVVYTATGFAISVMLIATLIHAFVIFAIFADAIDSIYKAIKKKIK